MEEQLRAGSLVVLEVVLEDVDTQRQLLRDQWDLVDLDLLVDLVSVASEVVDSVAGSMAAEDGVDSEAASRNEEAMVVTIAAAVEEVLAIREVVAFHPEEATAAIAVGMEDPTDTVLPQMLQLVQVAEAEAQMEVASAEEALVVPVLQIVMVLAVQRQLVGMTRVVAVAHMMIDPADTVAVEVTTIATALVEAAATWSR